jgi:hypothetical protein
VACLFCDSFDHCGTDEAVLRSKYSDSDGVGFAQPFTTFVRTGTHAMRILTSAWLERAFTASQLPAASGSTGVVGAGLYLPTVGSSAAGPFIQLKEGTTVHLTLALTRTGASSGMIKLAMYRGTEAGTLLGTSTYELNAGSWYYIEFKGAIHDTTGTYEVRVDGVNKLSDSNVDTRNAGTGIFNTVRVNGPLDGSVYAWVDDLYILDGSGASMNDFLGPQSVEWLVAQAGDGSNAAWTPSTGSDNGAMVDESTPDDDTTYNSSATVDQIDTYNLTNTSLVGTIRAVQSVLRLKKTDASARTIKTVFRSNSTDYDQTEREVLTTYAYLLEPRATDPNTSAAWASAAVNALQVGPKVFS